MVRLELPDKDPREFEYDFRQSVISLGRDPGNDIQIPLTTVSRNHARIFYERGDYFLEDLGSTHGTEHNGRILSEGEKRLLRDNDKVRVMSFFITFKTTAGTMLDRQPGEKTEQLARRMVQEVLSSLGGDEAEAPSLRVMNGPSEGRRFELKEDQPEVVIGRNPDCELPLDDQNISRRHCLIKRSWHGFSAQDLGSKNGVLVNGEQISGAKMLRDGDEVQIGGIKLTFIDPASRLLDQMGGLEDSMDPEGVGETEGSAGQEAGADEEEPEAYEAGEDEGESYDEAPMDDEPVEDSMGDPDMDMEEGSVGEPEVEIPAGMELPNGEVPDEWAGVAQKGIAWDMVILVFAGFFALAALGLVVFLLL